MPNSHCPNEKHGIDIEKEVGSSCWGPTRVTLLEVSQMAKKKGLDHFGGNFSRELLKMKGIHYLSIKLGT